MTLAPRWTVQTSGVRQRLRGVSAVSVQVAWASGAGSMVLRTADGGLTWRTSIISSDPLDFRDIDAIDAQTAAVFQGTDCRNYFFQDRPVGGGGVSRGDRSRGIPAL